MFIACANGPNTGHSNAAHVRWGLMDVGALA